LHSLFSGKDRDLKIQRQRVLYRGLTKRGSLIPFAFKPYSYKFDVACFETQEEAAKAMKESEKYNVINGIPVILEVLE